MGSFAQWKWGLSMSATPFRLSLDHAYANFPPGVDPLLPPALAAALLGVSEKWLANAREGRVNVVGPPFVKLGNSRTSHVRYRLSSLTAWIDSLEERLTTTQRLVSFSSFGDWQIHAKPSEKWLFAIDDASEPTDVFAVAGTNPEYRRVKIKWLTRMEFESGRTKCFKLSLNPYLFAALRELGAGDVGRGVESCIRLLPDDVRQRFSRLGTKALVEERRD